MTKNQFKVLRAMTSEIGLMLAERICRVLPLFGRVFFSITFGYDWIGQRKTQTNLQTNQPLYTKNTFNPAEKCERWEYTHNKWKSENFLCIYFRSSVRLFLQYLFFLLSFSLLPLRPIFFFCWLLCEARKCGVRIGSTRDEWVRLVVCAWIAWDRHGIYIMNSSAGINMVLHAIRHAKQKLLHACQIQEQIINLNF